MTEFLLNWATEQDILRTFLRSQPGVLHVCGEIESHPSAFMKLVKQIAEEPDGLFTSCVIDPRNIVTASPVDALREIVRSLGLSTRSAQAPGSGSYEIVKNVRSIFGPVSVSNIDVRPTTHSESQELSSLIENVRAEMDDGLRFDGLLLVFRQCHEMDDDIRQSFWASLWTPLLVTMISSGARAIFQFSEKNLKRLEEAIPPASTMALVLPNTFDASIESEIAALARERRWEPTSEAANALARTVRRTSASVREIYEQMSRLEIGMQRTS